jgi:hypothetical protein
LFCACYRHPNGNVNHFISAIENTITAIGSKYISFIAGDINIDLIKTDCIQSYDEYLKVMLCNQFTPTITLPTRITENSLTLIDHIFVRLPAQLLSNDIKAGNLYCDISDHLPNFCCVEIKPNLTGCNRPLVRLYSAKNFNNFVQTMQTSDGLQEIYNCNSVNDAYMTCSKLN